MNKKQPREIILSSQNGKLPPQALDLEEAVLGACMLEKGSAGKVITVLKQQDFYLESNGLIWQAIEILFKEAKPIDILTVTEFLRSSGHLELVGGPYGVTKLTDRVSSTANIEYHAHIVKQHSMQRSLIYILQKNLDKAWDNGIDPFDFSKEVAYKIESITQSITPDMRIIGKVAKQTLSKMVQASANPSELIGYPSSLNALNEKTLGYCEPDVTIIAAGTGEGKSTFILNEIKRFAEDGIPVAVFSLEMKDYQLMWKIISSEIGVDVKNIRKGDLSKDNWDNLEILVDDLQSVPIYFYDTGGLDIDRFCGIVKEGVRKHGIKTVFLDYIQLLTVSNTKDFQNREAQVNYISKRIKRLAMELNIPIQVVSQLSRMERGVKRFYRLSDLRESGAIEQDADNVIFIYRPLYHNMTETEIYEKSNSGNYERVTVSFRNDDSLLLIEKSRLGETGVVRCKFNGQFSKFTDMPSSIYNTQF